MRKVSGVPVMPVGRPFARFPLLTEMTFGLQGVFFIAGPTGIGKSTLAAHLTADVVAENFPGVYYESENGLGVQRLILAANDDARLGYLHYTGDFDEAIAATMALPRPGFLVVDTIQGSLDIEDHDARLDAPVLRGLERRAKQLVTATQAGHAVLVVSQINDRGARGAPRLGGLKGASALEQNAFVVIGYGGTDQATRTVILRKLRRPKHQNWPEGSRLTIRTDGQDRLSEEPAGTGPAAPRAADPGPRSAAEKVAAALATRPTAGVRALARLTGVPRSTVHDLLRASGKVSGERPAGHPPDTPPDGHSG